MPIVCLEFHLENLLILFKDWIIPMSEIQDQIFQIFCGANASNTLFNQESLFMDYQESFFWAEQHALKLKKLELSRMKKLQLLDKIAPKRSFGRLLTELTVAQLY